MHTGRLSVLARAAALLLAWALVVAVPVIAQEPRGASPSEPAVDTPAADGSRGAEPSTGSDQDRRGKKKGKGRARRQGGVPLQPGSTLPPTNLKKVGDHWTPYDPPDPESFPADATLHIIVPGDTLWDLADLVFGNPYLWPQIWNENRYIEDSHWIYPGDPLLLPARPTVGGTRARRDRAGRRGGAGRRGPPSGQARLGDGARATPRAEDRPPGRRL